MCRDISFRLFVLEITTNKRKRGSYFALQHTRLSSEKFYVSRLAIAVAVLFGFYYSDIIISLCVYPSINP